MFLTINDKPEQKRSFFGGGSHFARNTPFQINDRASRNETNKFV